MGKRNTDPLPEAVNILRVDIEEWRRGKASPGVPMPKAIWETAIQMAREFGVCRIARATGLDYVWLRKKIERHLVKAAVQVPTFVEVPIDLLMPGSSGPSQMKRDTADQGLAATGAVIEISTPDGARMRIQVDAGRSLCHTAGIVAAFMGTGR